MASVEVDGSDKQSSQGSNEGFHDDVADHVDQCEDQGHVDVSLIAVRKPAEAVE